MQSLSRGQRLKLADLVDTSVPFILSLQLQAPFVSDFACFGVDAKGRLLGDPYLIFFNQLATPCRGVELQMASGGSQFSLNLHALPAALERLVFTATVEGEGVMRALQQGVVELRQGGEVRSRFALQGGELADEKALMLTEIYRKDGVWRQAALGDGFKGGLSALLAHFGGEEETASVAPASVPLPVAPPAVSLSKAVRLEKELSQKAPRLVSLVKAANATLETQGLVDHVAKVCLVLDISGSMLGLYRRGVVQRLCERLLALACLFDDDKAIDVFLFDSRAIEAGEMSVDTIDGAVDRLLAKHKLGGGTDYAPVMNLVRRFYQGTRLPVYVLFVTDGAPGDKSASQKTLREASKEGVFWQFVGVGGERFDFLEKLDDLRDRFIDNADFFAVRDPSTLADEEIYRLLLQEYPGWLRLARQHGLIAPH
jgi:stress response protein SCP2